MSYLKSEAFTNAEDRSKLWRCALVVAAIILLSVTAAHAGGNSQIIGSRPAGCPHRFCGCALSLKIFGRIIPDLNLAWNWARKFPSTHARVGAVAVRRGHVLQIIGGSPGSWTVWDANSGGGKIRIHQRNLAGYRFVDPSSRMAGL